MNIARSPNAVNQATATTSPDNRWQNWSGLQQSTPADIAIPLNTHDLSQTIQHAQKCRVVGAGHSFSPLGCTEDTLITLDFLSGLVRHDLSLHQCTLHAGTRLKDLPPLLNPINQALINQGDIDEQSLAGACQGVAFV